jgi:ribonucleoside-triphosphate reductase
MSLEIGAKIDPGFFEFLSTIPEEIKKIEGINGVDPFELANFYFEIPDVADMSIDPNANITGKSPVNFHSEIFKPLLKLRSYYLLWKNLKKRYGLAEANKVMGQTLNGLLYFHDITKIDVPYCFAPDTSFLMIEGRPYGWLPSAPPNKMRSFMGQLREMTMDYSQENAGAIGIANALINLAYYTRKRREQLDELANTLEGLSELEDIGDIIVAFFSENYNKRESIIELINEMRAEDESFKQILYALYDKEIEDEIQQTIHIFHNTFRIGGDSPFTNISLFDRPTIEKTFATAIYPDGSKAVDNIEEIMRLQKIYAEFFVKGSPITGKPYRFPVTTVNINVDKETGKIVDQDFFIYMANLNRERCVFNWHIGEKIASCCRLTSDLAELKESIRMDSFGNGGLSIGSHRVVAINLHQVALISQRSSRSFYDVLNEALEMAEKLLIVHKEDILKERIKAGVLKFFNIKWADANMFFSTFGFTGLYDAFQVLTTGIGENSNLDIYSIFAEKTLKSMDSYAKEAGKRNKGFAFNVEEIPGENACPKMAMKDNFNFGTNLELLSNQMIPLYADVDLFTKLKVSSKLMNLVTGGSIFHFNVADELTPGANIELLRRLIEDYRIPHFALNKGFSTCANNHTTIGLTDICPECGTAIETHTTRVVGFFTDTKDWIKARREYEFPRRKWYGEEEIANV